jgi:hypothetical protein
VDSITAANKGNRAAGPFTVSIAGVPDHSVSGLAAGPPKR